MANTPVTNNDFATAVGCHFTTASKLRNGSRLPSIELLGRIAKAYRIPLATLAVARLEGAPAFSRLLRRRVFKVGT